MSERVEDQTRKFLQTSREEKWSPLEFERRFVGFVLGIERSSQETIRDRFAAAALTGIITHYGDAGTPAVSAYRVADDMLGLRGAAP